MEVLGSGIMDIVVSLPYGRETTLSNLIDSWEIHVQRLFSARDYTLLSNTYAWGPHDYVAALNIRDLIEAGYSMAVESRAIISTAVEKTDEKSHKLHCS